LILIALNRFKTIDGYYLEMILAVCIPCAMKDFIYLSSCIRSIDAQTRKPDMIIVSVSDVIDTTAVTNPYPTLSVPIEFVMSPETIHPGGNRNRAAAVAKARGADLLSFFDSDDIMHPERLDRVEKLFEIHPDLTAVSHNYMVGQKGNMGIYEGAVPIPWRPLTGEHIRDPYTWYPSVGHLWPQFQDEFKSEKRPEGNGGTQFGHITVRTSYCVENPFFEGVGPYGYSEDSHFAAGIIQKGYSIGYIPDILSLYQRVEYGDDFHIGIPSKSE
jgi:glycosyltransferase involved in cell wall biosynthesis